jgi:hypothetical protein
MSKFKKMTSEYNRQENQSSLQALKELEKSSKIGP